MLVLSSPTDLKRWKLQVQGSSTCFHFTVGASKNGKVFSLHIQERCSGHARPVGGGVLTERKSTIDERERQNRTFFVFTLPADPDPNRKTFL